jgi:hypothetical protein
VLARPWGHRRPPLDLRAKSAGGEPAVFSGDFGIASGTSGAESTIPMAEREEAHGRAILLAAKIIAIESAAAVGALTQREAAARCAALRAERDRATRPHIDTDDASILANAERLRAALVSVATDALRDALRRTLGVVRLKPVLDDGPRYLSARSLLRRTADALPIRRFVPY